MGKQSVFLSLFNFIRLACGMVGTAMFVIALAVLLATMFNGKPTAGVTFFWDAMVSWLVKAAVLFGIFLTSFIHPHREEYGDDEQTQ